MHSTFLRPCLPTAGKAVPATPTWLHEVKYDGHRLIVARDGDRVRLITRGEPRAIRTRNEGDDATALRLTEEDDDKCLRQ